MKANDCLSYRGWEREIEGSMGMKNRVYALESTNHLKRHCLRLMDDTMKYEWQGRRTYLDLR